MADAVHIWSPGFRLPGPSGVPVSSGYVEFYSAGTDNPLIVYANSDLTVSLGTTVYTDSAGYFVTAFGGTTKTLVYTGTAKIKVVVFDGLGGSITHDDIPGAVVAGAGGGATGITQAQGDVRYTRNANALTASASIVDADIFPFWNVSGAANKGLTYANLKTKLTTDFRADGRMFPVGTRMPFQQTTPSVGWTKETDAAYNDATLRFTTGTVASGGTASFNTVFASRTFTGTVGNDTPTVAKTALHDHESCPSPPGTVAVGASTVALLRASAAGALTFYTTSTGSSSVHNHSLAMNAADFAVKYVEMSIGVKA